MSETDVKIRAWVSTYGAVVLFIIALFYFTKGYLKRTRDKIFARDESKFAEIYNVPAGPTKQKLFAPLQDIQSADWDLRNKGLIRILEIGCGNGANLRYYPKGAHLIMVDRNEFYDPLLKENLEKHPSLYLEKLINCSAENMKMVPKESVDVVVSTIVLCSIDNMSTVLSEIKRVLVPGGKFFFLEHVKAPYGTRLSNIQQLLSVSRIWPTICGNGCRLDKKTDQEIKKAGFSSVKIAHLEIYTNENLAFKLIKHHIAGFATK